MIPEHMHMQYYTRANNKYLTPMLKMYTVQMHKYSGVNAKKVTSAA